MEKYREDQIKVLKTDIDAVYNWSVGGRMEKFIRSLKDRKITGVRCPVCKKVYVPPRMICEYCFAETADEVEVGPGGAVVSYTSGHVCVDADRGGLKNLAAPSVIALIKLDKADSCIVHTVKGKGSEDISIGSRVEAAWAGETKGDLSDISHFIVVK